ncbi:MAG: N5-carboxyaminoimidazole ribonucleotide synthase [Candidatus Saccharibacteria bacterium]|nr:N5-carboxyaminoimidazole ribonucleotide synthase [Candidatus Saccharibacteria bacterium]
MESQKTIGIIGGGQLGRMLTLAALPLGFRVVVVNPTPGSPAAQVGAEEIVGDLYDSVALHELAEKSDFITIEIEHLDVNELQQIERLGKPVNPSPEIIRIIQDKLFQKEFLDSAGIPVAPFVGIESEKDARAALKQFDGKMLIKTRLGAYDGRGNMVVESDEDIKKAFEQFAGTPLYAEQFIPFEKELAVMVARSMNDDIALYPLVQTIHERNICIEVLAPAPVSNDIHKKALDIANSVAELLQGAGTFGIEMFLTKSGKILINEIAPRVHNSGHYTTEASRTSQFEQHIRAISGLPLGDTSMVVPAAVMINILGERDGPTILEGLNEALSIPETSVHLYGKSPTKIDRKMGHITSTGKTIEEARERARAARKAISI